MFGGFAASDPSLARPESERVRSRPHSVDLVARYSKQTEQIRRVQKVSDLVPASWPQRTITTIIPYKIEERLAATDLERLVEAYERGATSRELAECYGLAKTTVVELLRKRGVSVRNPRVSAKEAALVVELYRQGVRQVDIAERIGRHKGVVWHLLRRAGAL